MTPRKKHVWRERMPVSVRGVTYDNADVAAEALGVTPATVYSAVSRGDPDRIGLGIDYENRENKGGSPPKQVRIAGRTFQSVAELARYIGRNPKDVRVSIRRGPLARKRIVQEVYVRAMREAAGKQNESK